jgi:hypothetical protein
VKAKTLFGRGTSTWIAMRNALVAGSAALVDNRGGKKRGLDTMQEPVAEDNVKEIVLLIKTLGHLFAESMKKKKSSIITCRSNLLRVAGEVKFFSKSSHFLPNIRKDPILKRSKRWNRTKKKSRCLNMKLKTCSNLSANVIAR